MTLETIDPSLTVTELLAACPQAIPVFLSHRMACVGCSMAAFESLGEAARIYGILPGDFINELNTACGQTSAKRIE